MNNKYIPFNEQEHIDRVKQYLKGDYMLKEEVRKIFYNYNELDGWRFYLKAIRNKDWESIKGKLIRR